MHAAEPLPRRVGRTGEAGPVGDVQLDGGDLAALLQALEQGRGRGDGGRA
ncbi:MAG: hypothetical protein WDM92_03980 [Caulobacteraceae bacterium]